MPQLVVVVSLMQPRSKPSHFLASLRLDRKKGEIVAVEELSRTASRQARNLDYKLRIIDALGLSQVSMMDRFRAGRALFSCAEAVSPFVAWNGAADSISLLQAELGTRILMQPDYDQK